MIVGALMLSRLAWLPPAALAFLVPPSLFSTASAAPAGAELPELTGDAVSDNPRPAGRRQRGWRER